MRKKVVAALMGVVTMAMLVVGCSAGSEQTSGSTIGDSGSQTTNEMDVEGEYTELEVWTFIELHQEFYVDMANRWNEEHPDQMVKLTLSNLQYDDMHNKLSLALESGEGAPDVVDIELGKFPSFMIGDVQLMDLTSVIKPYEDTTIESRLDIYSKDNIRYGLPTHVGATVAFYNSTALEEAGIDYSTIETWEDFKNAGVAYYEATGNYFACIETSAQWMINLMLAQKGGDYFDADGNLMINSKEMIEVLTFIKEMQDTGAFATVPGGQPDNDEAYPSYNNGSYAVQIMPFWQTSRFLNYMTDLEKDIAIAPTPVFEMDDIKSIGGGGTGTAIIKTSENAQLAAEVFAFIKLSEEANESVWNVLGFDPVNTDVWEDEAITRNENNKYVQFFNTYPFDTLNKIKDSIGSLGSLTNEKWPSVNNEFCNVTLNNIFESGMNIEDALKQSQETLENEFK